MAPNSSSNANALAFACLALATVVQAETVTKRLFLPVDGYNQVAWSASVVGACSDSTTYALRCSGTPTVGSSIAALPTSNAVQSGIIGSFTSAVANQCDSNAPPLTITEGPSGYFASTQTVTGGATILAENSCAISGMTSAECTMSLSVSEGSAHTAGAVPVAYTADQLPAVDVTITAGAAKLTAATDATCKSGAASQYVPIGLTTATVLSIISAIFVL